MSPRRPADLVPLEPLRPAPALARAIGATALLVILAIPPLSIRLGFGDFGNQPEDKTVRRAYDLLAEGFGAGVNGPLFVTVEGPVGRPRRPRRVRSTDQRDNVPRRPGAEQDSPALVVVNPESAPQDEATTNLV